MNKLKEKELLERLKSKLLYLRGSTTMRDEQAYQQIKEMIQDHTGYQELVARCFDMIIDLCDQLEGKKPEVTEEFIEKYRVLMRASTTPVPELLRRMLKEAGVEVKK